MKSVIRKASTHDVKNIAKIHVSSWAKTYKGLIPESFIESYTFEKRQALWLNIIEHELAEVLVAEYKGVTAGFLCFGQPRDLKGTQVYELSSIYISPEKIGAGIGQELYNESEKMLRTIPAKQVILWVLDSNERALNFYRKQGFIPTGKTRKEKADNAVLNDIELAKTLLI